MTERQPEKATPQNWWAPPQGVWTYDQVKDLELPFDWELVDGVIVVRGQPRLWHARVTGAIYRGLWNALREPLTVDSECCVMVNDETVFKPDVMVYDEEGLDFFAQECVPVAKAKLVVEVVSPGSRTEDRIRKPALMAAAGVPYFWRVEREDDLPVVHEFWLHRERAEYFPAPEHPVHHDKLLTEHPLPVDIDLRSLIWTRPDK